jgi:hypothetical protein
MKLSAVGVGPASKHVCCIWMHLSTRLYSIRIQEWDPIFDTLAPSIFLASVPSPQQGTTVLAAAPGG